ncbi:MAG: fibronectin type III domain-containing protein [Bacteroidetes bacterium]|nr:fibronectin type III domain-containing protein [Bacteroidota bacterium]
MRTRWLVAMKLSRAAVPLRIAKARLFVEKMTGNLNFPSPNPALASITIAAQKLEDAYLETQTGKKEATPIMYQRRNELMLLLKKLSHYIEDIANDSQNPEAVITSAGMEFQKEKEKKARVFSVKNGNLKGAVKGITASAGIRTSYLWQYRVKETDAWISSGITINANHIYKNLKSGTTYEFRVKIITVQGEGDWSNELELVVL